MQDVFLFAGDISENVALGQEGITDEIIRRVCRFVNAEQFIEDLPQGYEQPVLEGGATLSAGQRQLLACARALAADPRILVLDEATSNVDPESERLIQDAISKLMRDRTTLVIAHRLSTIRSAHTILVMHHGEIKERGTHEELMALKGIYYRLNRLKEVKE
jgi:ABC-type multidrug transport system fused ATPase/permease subunit